MKKSIAVDLDSTLNTLDEDWTRELSKRYNCHLTRDDMKDWNADSWKPPGCEDVFEPLKEPGWFDTLGIQPHSQEVIAWLCEHYDVYIATAYHPNTCVDKTNWIKRHFPMIDDRHIIFINPKYLLNTDYLIDDGPHNITAFKQQGVLIDAPWNQKLGSEYPRFTDWLQIKEYFEKERGIFWTQTMVDFLSEDKAMIVDGQFAVSTNYMEEFEKRSKTEQSEKDFPGKATITIGG